MYGCFHYDSALNVFVDGTRFTPYQTLNIDTKRKMQMKMKIETKIWMESKYLLNNRNTIGEIELNMLVPKYKQMLGHLGACMCA